MQCDIVSTVIIAPLVMIPESLLIKIITRKRFGKIPPIGDFGDFWWLLFSGLLVSNFDDMPFRTAHRQFLWKYDPM